MATIRARALAGIVLVALAATLTACVPEAPEPPTTPSSSSAPSSTPTTAPDPVLRPGDSAAANKQYFDFVNSAFLAAGMSDGRSIIDNLVAAGFIKQDMEVTADRTAIGLQVDSIIFSVRIEGECLIGQSSTTGYHSEIGPLLGTGGCLVGTTRPIDW